MYRILLVCTGNTCRSPMLETLLKNNLKGIKNIEVKSAGLNVLEGDKVNPLARQALKEYNLVIRHKPTLLTVAALAKADIVLTMTDEQKNYLKADQYSYKVFSLKDAVGYNISDPFGGNLNEYSMCARNLKECADILTKKLKEAGKI